jgi:hypothetical protein
VPLVAALVSVDVATLWKKKHNIKSA